MMYNDNDETYDNDDNVIWNDERLIRPRASITPSLTPAAARPTPRCRFQSRQTY